MQNMAAQRAERAEDLRNWPKTAFLCGEKEGDGPYEENIKCGNHRLRLHG